MIYLIIAQAARIAVIWTANYTAKRVLRSVVCIAVGCYLMERTKKQNLIDEKRGYSTDS